MAEELHQRVRREFWGYSLDEDLEANDLLKVRYQVTVNYLNRLNSQHQY